MFELITEYDIKVVIHPANNRITMRVGDTPQGAVWMTKEDALNIAAALISAVTEK